MPTTAIHEHDLSDPIRVYLVDLVSRGIAEPDLRSDVVDAAGIRHDYAILCDDLTPTEHDIWNCTLTAQDVAILKNARAFTMDIMYHGTAPNVSLVDHPILYGSAEEARTVWEATYG